MHQVSDRPRTSGARPKARHATSASTPRGNLWGWLIGVCRTLESASWGRLVAVVRDVSSDHEAVRTRGDFLADARDELGLPASTILTLADVLLEQDCPPPARHLAARIHTNASALTRVVEDLILLHRAETEPTRAGRAVPVDVMIEQALARVRDEARRRDIALATAAGPEDLSVAGDRTLLVAALTHLVRATLERSPEGSSVQVRPALVDRFAPEQGRTVGQSGADIGNRGAAFEPRSKLPVKP